MKNSRTQGASPRKSKKTQPRAATASRRTAERAHALIETILKEMQLGLSNPEHCATKEWDRLFGNKQSMVSNLQKLVAAMASLPPDTEARAEDAEEIPLTSQEMDLLKGWLAEK